MNLRSAFILTIVISFLFSCTKIETTDIGAGLIPPVDNISTFDTSLYTITENLLDTGSVYPLRTDNLVIGRISNDPLFGKTTGILNFEVKPEFFPYRFLGTYNSQQLDSVVLVLSYKGAWGDTNTTQTLNVYELSQTLKTDSIYTTKAQMPHKSALLGSATVDVRKLLADTLKPNKEVVNKNQIRIRITEPSFLQRLFRDTFLLDSNIAFRTRIQGLAVVPDTNSAIPNSLLVVNLLDTNTKMAIYYNYQLPAATKRDTSVTYFRFQPSSGANVNGFTNNIIRNPVGAQYVSALAPGADNLIYLQTRPDAPYAKIRIPGLDSLPNSIIHRAELIVQQVPNTATGPMDDYFSPPALFLTNYSTDSTRRFMIPGGDVEFSLAGVANLQDFGSYPFKRTINAQRVVNYAFNLTHYVQAIATRKNRNYDFVLSAPFADFVYASESFNALIPVGGSSSLNPLSLGRIRVGGGNHSQYRMRLRIIYTRI